MKNLNFKEIAIPTFALFVICLCVTALLAVTNSFTTKPIAEQNAKAAQESRETVCPDAVEFTPVDISGLSAELADKAQCYAAVDKDKNVIGYAISTQASGYGGAIKVMTGFDLQSGEIIKINVYDNTTETPGLGANTSKESFTNQFKGEVAQNGYIVNKDSAGSDSKSIDAVTGATISSRAVIKSVNQAVGIFNGVKEGAN